jgi:HAD superfamily hydrolase (TIGR01509 family)
LKNLAIQDYFKVILTYEDMTHSKDSKESFFQILNLLESKPEDCTYFDDTNEGLKIAKELGMKTIGVSNKFIQKFSSADKVIESFTDVEEE